MGVGDASGGLSCYDNLEYLFTFLFLFFLNKNGKWNDSFSLRASYQYHTSLEFFDNKIFEKISI